MTSFGATFQPGREDDPRARELHDDEPLQQAIQILAMRLPANGSSLLPDELLGYGRSDWQRYFERRRAAQLAPMFRGAHAGTSSQSAASAVVNNVLQALGVAQQRNERGRRASSTAPSQVSARPSVQAPAAPTVQAPVARATPSASPWPGAQSSVSGPPTKANIAGYGQGRRGR